MICRVRGNPVHQEMEVKPGAAREDGLRRVGRGVSLFGQMRRLATLMIALVLAFGANVLQCSDASAYACCDSSCPAPSRGASSSGALSRCCALPARGEAAEVAPANQSVEAARAVTIAAWMPAPLAAMNPVAALGPVANASGADRSPPPTSLSLLCSRQI